MERNVSERCMLCKQWARTDRSREDKTVNDKHMVRKRLAQVYIPVFNTENCKLFVSR